MPSNFVANGAEHYEASMGRWSQRLAGPFLAFVGVPARGRVLDAGAGTGSLTLAPAVDPDIEAIEALDFAEDYVSALRTRTADPRLTARQGDVCALPSEDASFHAPLDDVGAGARQEIGCGVRVVQAAGVPRGDA